MISDERRHFIGDQPRPPQGAQSEPGPSVRRTGPPRGHSALSDRSALGGKRRHRQGRHCEGASAPRLAPGLPRTPRKMPQRRALGLRRRCREREPRRGAAGVRTLPPPQALGKSGLDHLVPRGARGEQPGAGGAARPPGPRQRRRHGRPSGRRP